MPGATATTTATASTTSAAGGKVVRPVDDILADDPYLNDFRGELMARYNRFQDTLALIEKEEGGMDRFTRGYERFGFNTAADGTITYREWAPGADSASLIGEFNNWDLAKHPMKRSEFGVWEIVLPPKSKGVTAIPHNTQVKVSFHRNGERLDRIPAWINFATQDLSVSPAYNGIFWNPSTHYTRRHKAPPRPKTLRIYESHVGIASPEAKCATYPEFTKNILPRVKDLGYNAIQLMAIMEHPYYASFGYQVTNFFAASSRFGTPEQLEELVDTAHGMGIVVLLDVVHSHASKNVLDGLNNFDGTDHLYFHEGGKGCHSLWDSRLFNYGHREVQRFLLSNLRFWHERYGFDGYRFDGVTSMMYVHHGIGTGFGGGYPDYFGGNIDNDAILYLQLANYIMHKLSPSMVTIAEDVSGMPALCREVAEGGIGFDYRLGMAVPDMWIKYLKEHSDEQWEMAHIAHELSNRRWKEKTIAYCESHDQALVGDKSIAFWLMDKEMYTHMSVMTELTPVIDRGLALHKMIRLVTMGLGGEGYLNFMGNEFGHPEWLDFPRAGNNSSFHYARRQYNLVEDDLLRYKFLYNFDRAMQHLDIKYGFMQEQQWISLKHDGDKLLVFERGGLLWIFNFHPNNSYADYKLGTNITGNLKVILDSDSTEYGGHGRVDPKGTYTTQKDPWNGREHSVFVYIPCRTALVLGIPK
ncbi:hypothetical protein CXG81DRAFT_25788 [Caulochytrium protostelioides]|uniref:1,4-alpha-glucan-branching enzyme n=1 Tax=Caulochytrium protostelioides TaxID=1555241 RepID=A0A4P9X8B0_9FUNG|nr:glycoside hydrolase [Caulochytrium protostelioides]RKP01513.1 hypothetical protein CXG81DRAFT_25788 [Caulochytrium protostelioides]|eukprot:RKP01513.1 hypothetical protein CXG81DRAFT_25788 [Caulochytrium protostelioides]